MAVPINFIESLICHSCLFLKLDGLHLPNISGYTPMLGYDGFPIN
jgi:hypothetical protein